MGASAGVANSAGAVNLDDWVVVEQVSAPRNVTTSSSNNPLQELFKVEAQLNALKGNFNTTAAYRSNVASLIQRGESAFSSVKWEELVSSPDLVKVALGANRAIAEIKAELNPLLAIPLLITAILNKKNTDGLFRVSGNANTVKALVQNPTAERIAAEGNVHNLTGTLKQLVRELNPKLLHAVQNALLAAHSVKDDGNAEIDIAKVKAAVQRLGTKEKALLKVVIEGLAEISAQSASNRMTPNNLAIVMAPNLFDFDLSAMTKQNDVVKAMIENHNQIF